MVGSSSECHIVTVCPVCPRQSQDQGTHSVSFKSVTSSSLVGILEFFLSTGVVRNGLRRQLHFWDWSSGYKFDTIQSRVQPGSLESENGIFCCALDKSETRLLTGECDKTIKVCGTDSTNWSRQDYRFVFLSK